MIDKLKKPRPEQLEYLRISSRAIINHERWMTVKKRRWHRDYTFIVKCVKGVGRDEREQVLYKGNELDKAMRILNYKD